MANYRLRLARTNNLKLKVSARIPADLVGGSGIEVTRTNITYTIDLNYEELTTVLSINPALETTTYVALWESVGDDWSKITTDNLAAELGFPTTTTDNAIARYDGTAGALQNSGVLIDDSNNVVPATNDGGALGTTALKWSDLHLASGSVVNFNNGDVTVTHSANALAFAGASSGYSFDAAALPSANDAAALGSATVSWADLFLASGAVINFNNGDVAITHSADALAITGAGSLSIDAGAATSRVIVDADAGQAKIVSWRSDNSARWAARVDGAESGANAGGDFALRRYNDAGAFIDSPLSAVRSTGVVTIPSLTTTTFVVGASTPFSDSAGTLTLQNVDALDATTEAAIEAAIDTLANLTSIQGNTVTLTGAFIRSGAHSLTLTTTGITDVTLPTTGTLATVNGALGTPSSVTLTNATGLPVATGISGLGTGVATALAVNVGSAGAFITFNGALGTPSSGTLTNATGLPTAGLVDDAVTYAKMQNISATSRVLGRKTAGAGDTEELTFSEVLDFVGSAAQGDILYRNATAWVRLAAGTSGEFLKTNGAGANPAWATASGSATAATQAEMEAASSTTVFTTPGRQHFHPAHPKCWAYVTQSAGTYTLQTSYNITSITKNSTGNVTITIATDFSSANWCSVSTAETGSATANTEGGTKAAGTVVMDIRTASTNINTDTGFNFMGLGDQA